MAWPVTLAAGAVVTTTHYNSIVAALSVAQGQYNANNNNIVNVNTLQCATLTIGVASVTTASLIVGAASLTTVGAIPYVTAVGTLGQSTTLTTTSIVIGAAALTTVNAIPVITATGTLGQNAAFTTASVVIGAATLTTANAIPYVSAAGTLGQSTITYTPSTGAVSLPSSLAISGTIPINVQALVIAPTISSTNVTYGVQIIPREITVSTAGFFVGTRISLNLAGAFTETTGRALQIDSPTLTGGAAITSAVGLLIIDQKITGVTTGTALYQLGVNDINILNGATTLAHASQTLTAVPTFASDAAAGTGGLTAGRIYKDSTGGLHIKL